MKKVEGVANLKVEPTGALTHAWSLVHGFTTLLLDGRLTKILCRLPEGTDAETLLDAMLRSTVGSLRLAHPTHQSRSTRPLTPSCLAQWTQQKIVSPCCTPWPTMRTPQCGQTGASAAMAHSNESKVSVRPRNKV